MLHEESQHAQTDGAPGRKEGKGITGIYAGVYRETSSKGAIWPHGETSVKGDPLKVQIWQCLTGATVSLQVSESLRFLKRYLMNKGGNIFQLFTYYSACMRYLSVHSLLTVEYV